MSAYTPPRRLKEHVQTAQAGQGAFPTTGIMPKEETGAAQFTLSDGRGVVMAVLDTGVDPGADGLRATPHGDAKLIDIVDATGDGDIAMVDVKVDADGCVPMPGGRALRVGAHLPVGATVAVGSKAAYGWYPRGLTSRVREERKKQATEAWRGWLGGETAKVSARARARARMRLSHHHDFRSAR